MFYVFLFFGCTEPEEPYDPGSRTSSTAPAEEELGGAFAFPIVERELIDGLIGVDHDPVEHDEPLGGAICTAYDGSPFPACYDEHDGSDFLLAGGFETMDGDSATIIAARDGTVIDTHDGEYDRCHAEGLEVSCDGHPMKGNYVIIEHVAGVKSLYWHMKTDSVMVDVGDEVKCGDPIGLVGSSGRSALPHLHFELTLFGQTVDPYAGPESQELSAWTVQDHGDGLPGPGCASD